MEREACAGHLSGFPQGRGDGVMGWWGDGVGADLCVRPGREMGNRENFAWRWGMGKKENSEFRILNSQREEARGSGLHAEETSGVRICYLFRTIVAPSINQDYADRRNQQTDGIDPSDLVIE